MRQQSTLFSILVKAYPAFIEGIITKKDVLVIEECLTGQPYIGIGLFSSISCCANHETDHLKKIISEIEITGFQI